MAERRMFAKSIIDSDAFLDMPMSTQTLYFHLSMRADDDGFINNPKKIQRMIGATDDDFKLLIAKNFIIVFESGVIVIKHWKIHNYIRNDRYKPTNYQEEKALLTIKDNGSYSLGIPNGYQMDTQDRLGKVSIGKVSIDEVEDIFGYYQNEIGSLSPKQYEKLQNYLDKLSGELIIYAIDKTRDSGANSFRYLEAILKEWIQKEYTTLDQAKNEIKPSKKNKTIIDTPDWLNKEIEKEKSLITDEERKEFGII